MPIKQSIIERMELNAEDVKHSHTILYKRKGLYFFKNNIFFMVSSFSPYSFFDGKIYRILYFLFLHFQDVILDCLNPIPQ